MKSMRLILLYGFLVWLLTLSVSMLLYPLKTSWPVMFESIMPVVLTVFTVVFLSAYVRRCESYSSKDGVILGATWLAINVLLDLPLFSYGPMKMTLVNYFADIALTYFIIPAITIGAASQRTPARAGGEA
jgi:hypothetical protein